MSSEARSVAPDVMKDEVGGVLLDPRIDEYVAITASCLDAEMKGYAPFFADHRRLRVVAELLHRHFRGGLVLNVGAGCCAIEFFLRQLRSSHVVAFDFEPRFAPVYTGLRKAGHLANTDFFIGDAMRVGFARKFDLLLMHDLLYDQALDLSKLLDSLDPYLGNGGLLCFSVQDERARRLWQLLGQERDYRYRRYALPQVREELRRRGYELIECLPSALEARGRLNQLFKRLLWTVARISNQHTFLARKSGLA